MQLPLIFVKFTIYSLKALDNGIDIMIIWCIIGEYILFSPMFL